MKASKLPPVSVGEGQAAVRKAHHVELTGVARIYQSPSGAIRALAPVTLDIAEGEFVSILGPSGCGKSTLLKIVGGLEPPSSGSVKVLGRPINGPVKDLGFVFQQDVLVDWRTILGNVLLPIEFKDLDVKSFEERAKELLKMFGLQGYEGRRPWELSGGMRQRAAICRALIDDPKLLLMDEPFGALDALTRDELNIELQDIWQRSGKTVLFVTHSIAEAVFLSDRVVLMAGHPGEVVQIFDIEFPRPRSLDLREDKTFGQISRQLRELLQRHGAFRKP